LPRIEPQLPRRADLRGSLESEELRDCTSEVFVILGGIVVGDRHDAQSARLIEDPRDLPAAQAFALGECHHRFPTEVVSPRHAKEAGGICSGSPKVCTGWHAGVLSYAPPARTYVRAQAHACAA